ncbi:helix-turn-helix domain-containing protein [Metabacillus niabensis]|uniref:Transcriptional regulator with XRE-family HTH domain n=1 Tax=Metabacillus niabensis TaxID=324854 RepID=A0ABT9YVC6_9BACI|nr:helix-turn-helix domain-containing protein [Metabacillus niabensis]MDQ0223948.1 transcriptional regulator with XRE-family HTH domain [Metabacillus niabensis]
MEEIQKILGRNLKAIREKQKLSLEKVSELSGVSKAMIGQIERGESSPTITTIWKIANGLKISFTSLINAPETEAKVVLRSDVQVLSEDDGKYRVFSTFPFTEGKKFEIYSVEIDPEGKLESVGHMEGTEEFITVFDGEVLIRINGTSYKLNKDDSIRFKADKPHSYMNLSNEIARLSMTIYYPN